MQIKLKNNTYNIMDFSENGLGLIVYFNNLSYSELKNLFTKGDKWEILIEEKMSVYNPETETEEIQTITKKYNCNDYCIPGIITDYQDGTLSIEMKKITKDEIMPSESIKESQDFINEALKLSSLINDDLAIEYPNLFFEWKENNFYQKNDRVKYNDNLYKILNNHTSVENPINDFVNYK